MTARLEWRAYCVSPPPITLVLQAPAPPPHGRLHQGGVGTRQHRYCLPPPPFVQPPPPPPPVHPPSTGGVTWCINSEKTTGNHRRQRRRRKILVGYTRIQVSVVWSPSPPPGGGGDRSFGDSSLRGWGGTVVPVGATDVEDGVLLHLSWATVGGTLGPFVSCSGLFGLTRASHHRRKQQCLRTDTPLCPPFRNQQVLPGRGGLWGASVYRSSCQGV